MRLDGRSNLRTIRSYVKRAGRITTAQRRALDELWDKYGVEFSTGTLDLLALFGNSAPVTLEIGFGNGESLLALARRYPEANYLGVEVHEPGIGHCLLEADGAGIGNLRIIRHDAVEVLQQQLPDSSLSCVNLFFPDPWPKKRHHKRRIVQPDFVALLTKKLQPGGVFHAVTDWADYAEHMAAVVAEDSRLEAVSGPLPYRTETRFQTRGKSLGHDIVELVYRLNPDVPNDYKKEYK